MKKSDPFKLFLEGANDFDPGESKLCPNCKTLFKKRRKNQMLCSERCRNQVSCRRYYNKTKTTTTKRASPKRLLNTAAPAMLAALENALLSADAEWENKNLGHDWREACEQMRAALEAAERGEE